jgi:tripartite-type tricarboxylate transporter receptor subunit TctC
MGRARLKELRYTFAVGVMAVGLLANLAQADFPDRTVRIVVPFDAGGTVDAVARALANRLNVKWNVPVIVENRPGAGNTIGAAAVAKAEPDGHTLLFANTSVSVNPSLFKSLPYDTLRDLSPVVYLSPSPNILLAQRSLGIASLSELIALAKSRPATPLSYASVGRGSAHHFCMELLKSEAGIELLHVPYRGVAPAVLAVTRGEVDLYCSDIPGAINLLRGDKVTALGITSSKRSPTLPDIPPIAEAGVPGFDAVAWLMVVAPAGTPKPIVGKLHEALKGIVASADVQRRLLDLGNSPLASPPPDALEAYVKSEIGRWGKVVHQAGIAGSE